MVNELRFWPFDPMDVGDESDEEGEEDEDITAILKKGIDDEDNSDVTVADRMLSMIEEDFRDAEREELYQRELSVSQFQLEP